VSDKPKLTYFDAPVSRGEECRLALHLAGIEFEDVRVKMTDFPVVKAQTPFGGVPTLELPGKPMLAECNAILVYVGRRAGLHPEDLFEAARHEMLMSQVEVLRGHVSPTLRMHDDEKQRVREGLVASFLPTWAANIERQLTGDGPFVGGTKLCVSDLKLHMAYRWFSGGKVDHIPATIFASYPRFVRLHEAVRDHAGVKAWYARS
jgi:glutathione S-transferase